MTLEIHIAVGQPRLSYGLLGARFMRRVGVVQVAVGVPGAPFKGWRCTTASVAFRSGAFMDSAAEMVVSDFDT
ncbi:hypothetical protein GCM10009828_014760 [Actinoplanes couchii]